MSRKQWSTDYDGSNVALGYWRPQVDQGGGPLIVTVQTALWRFFYQMSHGFQIQFPLQTPSRVYKTKFKICGTFAIFCPIVAVVRGFWLDHLAGPLCGTPRHCGGSKGVSLDHRLWDFFQFCGTFAPWQEKKDQEKFFSHAAETVQVSNCSSVVKLFKCRELFKCQLLQLNCSSVY